MSPFLATESDEGVEWELEWRAKDFHKVVYATVWRLFYFQDTKWSTERVIRNLEPPCGCGSPYWAQTGRKKITPTPNDCLLSPNYRHSLCGEPGSVGKGCYAIFHCSNPHGMLQIWGTQYDSFTCHVARYLRRMLLQHVQRSGISG
jgi:hypothetical protein